MVGSKQWKSWVAGGLKDNQEVCNHHKVEGGLLYIDEFRVYIDVRYLQPPSK